MKLFEPQGLNESCYGNILSLLDTWQGTHEACRQYWRQMKVTLDREPPLLMALLPEI